MTLSKMFEINPNVNTQTQQLENNIQNIITVEKTNETLLIFIVVCMFIILFIGAYIMIKKCMVSNVDNALRRHNIELARAHQNSV